MLDGGEIGWSVIGPDAAVFVAEDHIHDPFPPKALCLEVTESVMTDVALSYVLAEVRKLRVRVAIDDFGTGFSSLSYLRRLPADVVKLDRSFLAAVAGEARGATFVGAVVALAHAVGMSVVVEGVETQAQFDIAMSAAANMVEGFPFALPLSAKDAAELAAGHGPATE